ncbi:hypothetical protein [Clostridium novyi]|uniref:hypothetical protein n=1 Tax=Clostridium novyi TaxID=1542 RepID=UPI000B1B353B|nr:hypothetical protein [Clostridium novyi]
MEIINSSQESLNRVNVCADNYGCSTRMDAPDTCSPHTNCECYGYHKPCWFLNN